MSGSRSTSTSSSEGVAGSVSAAGCVTFQNITELRSAMEAGSLRAYGSPVMTLKDTIDNHFTGGYSATRPGVSGSASGDAADGAAAMSHCNGATAVDHVSADGGSGDVRGGRLSDEYRRQSSPGLMPGRDRDQRGTQTASAYTRQVRLHIHVHAVLE